MATQQALSGAGSGAAIGTQIMPGWGTAIGAGIGALGGVLGSGGQDNFGPGDAMPKWLFDDWKNTGGQIAGLQTPQYYQGQQIADQSPWTQNALNQMGDYGNGMGGDLANMQMQGGQMGLDAMGSGLGYMDQLQRQGPNKFQYDQGLYEQTMGNQMGGYQGMFDQGAQQLQQNFDWNQLPGLNMANAMGGGGGNTKFGQAGTLGQAMTNQNIAGFGADLWGQANQMANQNAYGAGSQNLNSANQLQGQLLSNYGNYAQLGSGMANNAYDMGKSNIGMGMAAGNFQDAYNQSQIDADMNKWNFEQQAPWTALNQQLTMMKAQGLGGQPNNTNVNPWAAGMQGALGGVGLYNAGQNAGWWGGGDTGGDPYQDAANNAFGPVYTG